jgi:hypothetical protein
VRPAASGAASELPTGKASPFVFATQSEINYAQKQLSAQRGPSIQAAFREQRARADRWLKFTVPGALPFDRRYGDAARDLALAYAVTRDEQYAAKAAELLRALARTPEPAGRSALYLSVHALPLVFSLDLLSPYLGRAAAPLQHQLLEPVVRALRATPRRGLSNQDVWANAAVAAIGFLREEQALVDWALFDPDGGVLRQLDQGLHGDGIWHERPAGSHFYALQAFLVVAEAVARSGMAFDLYTWTSPRGRSLRQMFVSPLGLLDPSLTLPGAGDAFGTPKIQKFWHYWFGWRRYGDPAFAWVLAQDQPPLLDADVFATAGPLFNDRELPAQPVAPEAPSQAYPEAGWLSLRSHEGREYWHADAVQVLLSYGGGETHDHADKLNLDIAAFAERLVEDKSVFIYGDGGATPERPAGSRHQLWDRQTVAHNTVVVDQRSQPGAQALFQASGVRGQGEVFVRCGPVKVARARADTVYPGVQYARQVALVGGEYLVDLFRLESETTHVYDWVLHVNRPPHEAPRTELTWQKAPPFQGGDGYQLIRNRHRSPTPGPWSLEWPKLKLWMTAGGPTEVNLAEGYGGPVIQRGVWQVVAHPEPSWIPLVLARREAPRTVFAAVLELFPEASRLTRVEALATEAGLSAVRLQRPEGVDLFAARWGPPGGAAVVVDPVTTLAVPVGGSFTLAQVRGERVHLWADAPAGAGDFKAPPDSGAGPATPRDVIAHPPCVNELQGPPGPSSPRQ